VPTAKPTLCIVNYNGERFLPTTLAAATAAAAGFSEILLIDNASTDGSVALAERDFPHVRIHRMPDNRGPGAMRNAGLALAASDLVLFIDNDVAVTPDCGPLMAQALLERPTVAIAAARVLYADRPDTIQYDGASSHFLGMMTLENPDRPLAAADRAVRTTLSVVTCAFMVDRRRLPESAPFDESFFIYQEDHDFGVRMRALGVDIISVPSALCLHGEGSAGISIRETGSYSSRRVFSNIRNRWLFILKTYQPRSLLVLLPMLLVYELAQLAIVLRKGWLREWRDAVAWVARNWRDVMGKRRSVQCRRVRPDRELLAGGALPLRAELTSSGVERGLRAALDGLAALYWRGASRLI
jgi:GT2 family glycosyltransferase